ncbi:MAG: tRNA pseudouridine55 synthase [Chloroflexi bacterium]|jgi:tRNA pseudouridine55 synthase|nr:MAG: tRNA pseudouridine55 synthase [Chloroflexota bacterium]
MPESINGIINVNKPPGITSMDVIRRIRRASGLRRVGHSGTLDPLASGVMVVALGVATRLLEYVTEFNKSYAAKIELGKSTDTYDGEGEILNSDLEVIVSNSDVRSAIQTFKGTQSQIPPMHSAIKVNGVKLYDLARKGITIDRAPRLVNLYDACISDFKSPELELQITCSKGFYVRAFANDLGVQLGCGAYLKKLVRTSVGKFNIENSLSLDFIETNLQKNKTRVLLHKLETVLDPIPKLRLDFDETKKVQTGISIPAEGNHKAAANSLISMALTEEGKLVAIMRFNEKDLIWKPEKVFHDQMQKIN